MVVEVRGDSVYVTLDAKGVGETRWLFEAIEVKRKDFDCQLGIEIESVLPGFDDCFPPTHFSGASASSRDTWRRLLDGFYGKGEIDWARLLPKAYALARDAFLAASQTVDLAEVELDWEESWWVDNLWPHEGVTILFGQGSHGKGHLTTNLALHITGGAPFLGKVTRPGNLLYLDYEATEKVLARRLNRHILGSEFGIERRIHYMSGRAIPVADQIEAVRRELDRCHARGLIVDSAIPAVGGDPLKAEVVGRMFNALNTLRLPVWLLAHVTKAGEEEFPFGSVFWHNLARMTWFIKKVDDEDQPDIQVALFNKKINEGRRQASYGATIAFDDPTGPIRVLPYELTQDAMLSKSLPMSRRMWAAIALPKLTSVLALELGTTPEMIRTVGGRMKNVRPVKMPGERESTWSRVSMRTEEE